MKLELGRWSVDIESNSKPLGNIVIYRRQWRDWTLYDTNSYMFVARKNALVSDIAYADTAVLYVQIGQNIIVTTMKSTLLYAHL